jgi:hypothetical protein
MARLCLAATIVAAACAAAQAEPQVAPSLSDAAAQAKRTGRPIFAIAYSESCPICQGVRKTLASDESLRPVLAHFVSLAIDVETPDFRKWERVYPRRSSAIPGLYVVTAAGEQVYGNEGGLAADELKKALVTSLEEAGRMPNDAALATLTAAIAKAEEHWAAGRVAEALAALRTAEREFSRFGEVLSLTPAGERATTLMNQMEEHGRRRLAAATSSSDPSDRWGKARALAATEQAYSVLPGLKAEIQEAVRAFGRSAGDKLLLKQARDLARAETLAADEANSKKAKAALQRIIERYPNSDAAREAAKLVKEISGEATSADGVRRWTDSTGRFTVEAELVEVADGQVKLRTVQGKLVTVPVAKLDADAKAHLESQ